MKRMIFAVLAVLTTFVMFADTAEARRGGRIPIVIPGFGGGEEIVKVMDLPDKPFFKRPDGKYVDLGYLHQGDGGKWIGYIGSSSTYVPLDQGALELLLTLAGVDELPPVPERKSGGFGGLLIIGLIALVAIVPKTLRKLMKGPSPIRAGQRLTAENESDLDWAHLDAELRQAAQEQASPSKAVPRQSRRMARAGTGQQQGFGRRKA